MRNFAGLQTVLITLSVLAVAVCAGCQASPSNSSSSEINGKTIVTFAKGLSKEIAYGIESKRLKAPRPRPDSVGVIVGSPVVTASASTGDLNAFSNGIGWYLNNAVAGAPEFGQTPLRTTVVQVVRERNITAPQMSLTDIAHVAHVCGATHVATAEIAETPGGLTLTYSLHIIPVDPEAQPVAIGSPFVVTAKSREELLAQLPDLAEKLRAALGAPNSLVSDPPLQGVTPDTFVRIGKCIGTATVTRDTQAFIYQEGLRNPLVAEIAVLENSVNHNATKSRQYADVILRTMPKNTQAMGYLGHAVPYAILPHSADLYSFSRAFPMNYALAQASAWTAKAEGDYDRSDAASALAASDAPANPEARLTNGRNIENKAGRVRQGRYDSDMSRATWATIQPLYEQSRDELRAATECDPLYGLAWVRLAEAATFSGDVPIADYAMSQARLQNTGDPYRTYDWALEMYAPKWSSNSVRLIDVASGAAQANFRTNDEKLSILSKLDNLHLTLEKDTLEKRLFQECAAKLARNPKNIYALYLRGKLYDNQGNTAQGSRDFEAYSAAQPNDPGALFDLGLQYVVAFEFAKAEGAFRQSIALRPNNVDTLSWLGWTIKRENRPHDAEPILRRCLALNANFSPALSTLGTIYGEQKRYREAIPLLEHALRFDPFDLETNVTLAGCYAETRQDAEGIKILESLQKYYPDNVGIWSVLGELYVHADRWTDAEFANRNVLKGHPDDGGAHTYLGDSLAGQGRLDAARKEWQQAVSIGSPADGIAHAKDQLKKHPAS